jgi:branched-chain amino acid transport system ATP-binding protein
VTLHVEQLSARYGSNTVLRDVDLDVRSGQVLALIGANGVGKSTLLNSIAGLHRTAGGSVTLDGQPILGKAAHRIAALGLVLVPEGRHLFGELTVLENLTMGMHGLGYSRAAAQEQTESVFAKFPILAEFSARRAGLLSGGQQQMLAIGRALVRRPKVLLLDEPSLGLAPLLVQQILETVRTLASGDVAVILAEQNAAAALRVADRGAVLDSGRVVRVDDAAVLLEDELVSQHYLGGVASGAEPTGVSLGELPPVLRERSLAPSRDR